MSLSRHGQIVLLLVAVFAGSGISADVYAADAQLAALIERRVNDWQPTRDERLLDQVGWASDLVEAQRLAKKHGRPLFVFTYSGSTVRAKAIALQRC